jgi:hypothetical protein
MSCPVTLPTNSLSCGGGWSYFVKASFYVPGQPAGFLREPKQIDKDSSLYYIIVEKPFRGSVDGVHLQDPVTKVLERAKSKRQAGLGLEFHVDWQREGWIFEWDEKNERVDRIRLRSTRYFKRGAN